MPHLGGQRRHSLGECSHLVLKELLPVLRDEAPLATALDEIRRNTRHLARRQETWWKRFPDVHWLDVPAGEPAEATGVRVADTFLASPLLQGRDDEPVIDVPEDRTP